ncbi:MAG: indolepyruvate oxidoreductase subunit beta family protein [Quadrisphaera sp.]
MTAPRSSPPPTRVYSVEEKLALGDGRVDSDSLLDAARAGSKRLVAADFNALALKARSVISASLFGAFAGCGALPVGRERFEEAIRASGKGVEASLRAFAAGYDAAQAPATPPAREPRSNGGAVALTLQTRRPVDPEEAAALAEEQRRRQVAASDPASLVGPALTAHVHRVVAEFPASARDMLLQGLTRTAVYQGTSYTDRYLDRVARLVPLDPDDSARLVTEAARHVALWMTYQDTIHVAHQKIRRRRLQGVRDEAGAKPDQLVDVREYLHPQIDEITDTLPTALGRRLAASKAFGKVVAKATRDGIVVNTTGVVGYSMLWTMAQVRPLRPRSLRYGREQAAIDSWLDTAVRLGARDPHLAREVIECQRVLKGYGATHEHGRESFGLLMEAVESFTGAEDDAPRLARLRAAALADEDGATLRRALGTPQATPARAAG